MTIAATGDFFSISFPLSGEIIKPSFDLGLKPAFKLFQEVELAPPGHVIRVQWQAALGATVAEVNPAELLVRAAVVEEAMPDMPVEVQNNFAKIKIPAGKRVRRLLLNDLKLILAEDDKRTIRNSSDLPQVDGQPTRLVVGWQPAQFSVPAVGARGGNPPVLTGARYQNNVLNLPDIEATTITLGITRGSLPEEFSPLAISVGGVSGTAAIVSRDIELVNPAGKKLFALPGEYPADAAAASVQLGQFVQESLNEALGKSELLDINFRLRGKAPGKAGINQASISGALVRTFTGIGTTNLAGEPALGDPTANPPVLTGGKPLAAEVPAAARGDLTVRYEGLRILETVSDDFPSGAVSGAVVGETAVIRNFSPAAFNDIAIGRIGLVGRAPEECELSVAVVDWSNGVAGKTLGAPGVVTVPPASKIGIVWVELKNLPPPKGAIALSVRANRGRFLWASTDRPLLRVAIYDPDPGNRPLNWGGVEFLRIAKEMLDAKNTVHLPGKVFPTAMLRDRLPLLDSPLFLKVDITDLELRYKR
jgi:hypothetical protein